MAERNPSSRYTAIVGTPVMSGTPNTAQLLYTLGGQKNTSVFSGIAGGDTVVNIGGGRLDNAFFHPGTYPLISGRGQAVEFYDAAATVSGGGPISGCKIVGVLFPDLSNIISGNWSKGVFFGEGNVFTSGLAYTGRSGQPGFSINYSPVVSG